YPASSSKLKGESTYDFVNVEMRPCDRSGGAPYADGNSSASTTICWLPVFCASVAVTLASRTVTACNKLWKNLIVLARDSVPRSPPHEREIATAGSRGKAD